jgi:hypothetical protein
MNIFEKEYDGESIFGVAIGVLLLMIHRITRR